MRFIILFLWTCQSIAYARYEKVFRIDVSFCAVNYPAASLASCESFGMTHIAAIWSIAPQMTHQMIRDYIYEYLIRADMSSWRNRLARSTVNREVVGSIPTEDASFFLKINSGATPRRSNMFKRMPTSSSICQNITTDKMGWFEPIRKMENSWCWWGWNWYWHLLG